MRLDDILVLADHGPDTFVATGPRYPWGGLYGGQIVSQGLAAAARTVEPGFVPHSLRCYFIQRGDHTEPVRYEVDRIRNGRSFCTRRIVARQAVGAILNLEASFQQEEASVDVSAVTCPSVPGPEGLRTDSWSPVFERAMIPAGEMAPPEHGMGRAAGWLRVADRLGDDPVVHRCGLAYLSDDLPTDAVVRAHPVGAEPEEVRHRVIFSASLDHTIWFHREMRSDEWHLHDFTCHAFVGGRGLAIGHVFTRDGAHVATVAQETLLRDAREREPHGAS